MKANKEKGLSAIDSKPPIHAEDMAMPKIWPI